MRGWKLWLVKKQREREKEKKRENKIPIVLINV